jgi:hypothetical protein
MTERSEAAALLFSALLFLAYSGVKLREGERDRRRTIGRDTGRNEKKKKGRSEREVIRLGERKRER